MKYKKAFSLIRYPIAILLFSMVVIGFYRAAQFTQGTTFWNSYGYTPPANNITVFNRIDNMSLTAEKLACDMLEECPGDLKRTGEEANILQRLFRGAGSGFVTLYKAFTIPKLLIQHVLGGSLGIPAIIIDVAYISLLLALTITILLIIFNRSDGA